MRVLIAGCGYVGSALGEMLASEGHEVFGARRNPERLPPAIRPVRLDFAAPISPRDLPENLDAVVYAASAGGSTDAAYETAYVDGPRNLLSALRERGDGVRRVVFVSSTAVYAQTGGEWVDEDSPTEPEGFRGRRLLEGERVVSDGPFPSVVIRLAGIYGPGRTRSLERALEWAEDGQTTYTNRIHRDDCAGALRHVLFIEDPAPVYIGADSEPAERRVVGRWLAERLDVRDRSSDAPSGGRGANKRCSNARLLASGYDFRYPTFREGFAALLDERGA